METSDLADLALRLLYPDPELRGKLFHLAVLGEVLLALQPQGLLVSHGPLGSRTSPPRPDFTIEGFDREWHLWFEAAGVWSAYGELQPYRQAASNVSGSYQPLGADLLLIDANRTRALSIECKYSADPSVVGRDGYHQATTYLSEAQNRLCDSMVSVVVGPASVVDGLNLVEFLGGKIGFADPDNVRVLVHGLVSDP